MTNVVSEKAIAGRARKAARAEQKEEEEAAAAEAEEEARWQQGAKGRTAADERRQKADKRLRKKKELARITAKDEKALLASLNTQTSFQPCLHLSGLQSHYLSEENYKLDKYFAALTAPSLWDAIKSIKSLEAKHLKSCYRCRGRFQEQFHLHLESAFEKFIQQEDIKIQELLPKLVRRKREAILWDMFRRAACNPTNDVFPSSEASVPEKLKILKDMRRELRYLSLIHISEPTRRS